jgi:hypothetical protein
MYTTKLISVEDLHLVEAVMRSNPRGPERANGELMSDFEIKGTVAHYEQKIKEGVIKIVLLLDDDKPMAFYSAYILSSVGGWVIHGPRVAEVNNSYITTAKMCAPALDTLLEHMESLMYFKFWQVDARNRHIHRRNLMEKYSKNQGRYDYYNEILIPGGNKTGIVVFDNFAAQYVGTSDRMIRMFVLKQEYRDPLIENYYERNKNETI